MNRRDFLDIVFFIGVGCLIQSTYEDDILVKKIVKLPVSEIYDKSWTFIGELINKNGVFDLLDGDIELIRSISCWNKQYRSYYGDEYLVLDPIPPNEKGCYVAKNYFIYLELINPKDYWEKHNGRFEKWRHKKDWG